jgi:RND superfamily putative drug exporter
MFSPDGELVVNNANDVALLQVAVRGDSQSPAAFDALNRLRNDYIPDAFEGTSVNVYVGGQTAWTADYSDLINTYTPFVFTFVLGLSFVILLVVFRSIVVPIKAIVMNLLSVGASYGLMVLVFQHGVGADLFGFNTVDRIESWVPLFMFAILFGLSMDYHVFLLSRIRERFDETHDNAGSVAYGVRSTAGLITGAALIMVAVFSGFALGELTMFQQMGFGLAVSVFLDASVVRLVLVPASMELLGTRNWYLPSWLEWLPKINVEGAHVPAQPQLAPQAVEAAEPA